MPQIWFKKQFFDAIRDGRKTTTVRRWKSCAISAGDRVFSPGLGWLRVSACDRVELGDLKEADARADGFESLKELHKVLRRLYPKQSGDGRKWYRIRFRLDGKGISAPASRAKRRKKAGAANGSAKIRLAERIRLELDKAVRASGSLFPL
jgi:hypothetical protein